MKTKLLTITIPSYKQEIMLRRALLSLSDQTFKDFEVLILDDKSEVDFKNILNEFSQSLNIEIRQNTKNLGAMENMRHSIMLNTDTKYVLSLHEDDYLSTNYIENAIKEMESDENISLSSTRPWWILKSDPYIQFKQNNSNFLKLNHSELVLSILKSEPIMFSSIIYRSRDIYNAWNYEKYNTFCDRVLLIDILKKSNSTCLQLTSPGIAVRDHSKDQKDTRSKDVKFSHFINLMVYYSKNINTLNLVSLSHLIKYFFIGIYYFYRK